MTNEEAIDMCHALHELAHGKESYLRVRVPELKALCEHVIKALRSQAGQDVVAADELKLLRACKRLRDADVAVGKHFTDVRDEEMERAQHLEWNRKLGMLVDEKDAATDAVAALERAQKGGA